MSEQPDYNPLDPEFEARMRAKREATRREREGASQRSPRHFSEWELLELLGEGPSARVHRARGPNGELVALKCLRGAVVAGVERAGAREEFLDSVAERLVALRHPNLLRVLGLVRDGDRRALALELREEETLDALLRRRPALPWREAVRIGRAVAAGLAALGIPHDDVKARNVFVGEDGTVLLADPSSARTIDPAGGDRAIALAGTPQTMAPERLRGEAGTASGDVYSLGCVLYQMVAGRLPYKGPLVAQLREAQDAGQRAPLRSPLGGLPEVLTTLVDSMLEIDPARRPDPAELETQLQSLEESAEDAVEEGAWSPARRVALALAVLAFLVLLFLRSR